MLRERFGVSQRRACTVVGIHRSTMRLTAPPITTEEAELRAWLRKFSAERPRWGWRRAATMARRAGWQINNKRIRRLWCDKYDRPYTTGSFLVQYAKARRIIAKLSLPNAYLTDTSDDAPEARSERMFAKLQLSFANTNPATGRRRGRRTATAKAQKGRTRS